LLWLLDSVITVAFNWPFEPNSFFYSEIEHTKLCLVELFLSCVSKCPAGTCDGCSFYFLWESSSACPRCTNVDYHTIEGACKGGVQVLSFTSSYIYIYIYIYILYKCVCMQAPHVIKIRFNIILGLNQIVRIIVWSSLV